MKIKTHHVYPPIPIRDCDWTAIDDDTYDGPGSAIGVGPTEQEAIDDLIEQLRERDERRKEVLFCDYCGSRKPIGQSCGCFDNNCE